MRTKYFLLFVITLAFTRVSAQTAVIPSHDTHIRYMGRINMLDEAAELSWSASSAKINFYGTGVKVTIRDEHGENSFNVILDGKIVSVLHPDTIQKEYTLAKGLPAGNHTVELFKRTEWAMGKTWLYGFSTTSTFLPPPPSKKRKMEIFGNSISCGYAVIDYTG